MSLPIADSIPAGGTPVVVISIPVVSGSVCSATVTWLPVGMAAVAVVMATGQTIGEQADGGSAEDRGTRFDNLARAAIVIIGRRATGTE